MKKILLISTLISILAIPSFAQNVGVLSGPSGIPCAYLMENCTDGTRYEVFASAQTELPKLLNGELDIGFLPPNMAAKVYTKNKGAVICLGVTGNGNLYVITRDGQPGSDMKSLEGMTVHCAGQGATPEYMARHLIEKTGAKDVTLDFSIPNAQLAPSLLSGKIDAALVPEPFPTVAESSGQTVRLVDIQEQFRITDGGSYPMTVLVVNSKYAKKNRPKVESFIEKISGAISWTKSNPEAAGSLVEKHGIGLKSAVASKSIPNANYIWIPADKSVGDMERLLEIFLGTSPESVGGKIPDRGFYFK